MQPNESKNEAAPGKVSDDAVHHAGTLSQVSQKRFQPRSMLLWGLLAVVLVMVVFMPTKKKESVSSAQAQMLSASDPSKHVLTDNLAKLKLLDLQKPRQATVGESFTPTPSVEPMMPSPQPSKAYLARQNAPTSMYANAVSVASEAPSQDTAANTPFAGTDNNARFANAATLATTVNAQQLAHPDYTLANGEFIHAVLETAVSSDLPGMVRAIVSRPAYAYTGHQVIVPAGTRLIGQYSSQLVQGQRRILVIWNRVLLPNGVVAQLNSPGTDALGRAGQGADSVDTHFMERFGESSLLSLIGAGTATLGVNDNDHYNSASEYRMAVAQSFRESAQNSLQDNVAIKPTLHIYQGAKINVFVAHDVNFYEVLTQAKATAPQTIQWR